MAGYSYKGDYVTEAVSVLLLADYRNAPNLKAVITSYAEQIQDLEDDVRDLIEQILIPNAVGVQLDRIGKVIGQLRWGRIDADYRRLLLARIAANSSDSTPEAQIAVVIALFPDYVAPVVYSIPGNAVFALAYELSGASSQADRDALQDLLLSSAPAGVGFYVTETISSPSPAFQLDTAGAGYDDGYLTTEVTASA
jgi:hypothetical protein